MAGPIEDQVIAAIEGRKAFRLTDITDATDLPRRPVLRILDKLCRQGYLNLLDDEERVRLRGGEYGPARRNPQYEVLRDLADRKCRKPKRGDTGRDKIWRTIRALRRFTRTDLERLTGCPRKTIDHYVRMLDLHGFIRSARNVGHEKFYTLINDVGPNRPETPEAGPEEKDNG